MKKYQIIELIEEYCGFAKGTKGIIIDEENGNNKILFLNEKNVGDFACISVKNKFFKKIEDFPLQLVNELENFVKNYEINEKNTFEQNKFKEFDFVELLVEKEKYSKHGVHKGMCGVIMADYAVKNQYYVIFSEEGSGKDIADICVNGEDLKLVD